MPRLGPRARARRREGRQGSWRSHASHLRCSLLQRPSPSLRRRRGDLVAGLVRAAPIQPELSTADALGRPSSSCSSSTSLWTSCSQGVAFNPQQPDEDRCIRTCAPSTQVVAAQGQWLHHEPCRFEDDAGVRLASGEYFDTFGKRVRTLRRPGYLATHGEGRQCQWWRDEHPSLAKMLDADGTDGLETRGEDIGPEERQGAQAACDAALNMIAAGQTSLGPDSGASNR